MRTQYQTSSLTLFTEVDPFEPARRRLESRRQQQCGALPALAWRISRASAVTWLLRWRSTVSFESLRKRFLRGVTSSAFSFPSISSLSLTWCPRGFAPHLINNWTWWVVNNERQVGTSFRAAFQRTTLARGTTEMKAALALLHSHLLFRVKEGDSY